MLTPKYLYRYCAWNDRAKLLLLRNAFYLPSPIDFNDPFDCLPPIEVKVNARVLKRAAAQWSSHLKQRLGTGAYVVPTRNIVKAAIDGLCFDYNEFIRDVKSAAKVLCFTEVRNNLLMWSHYAAGHTGICLRMRISDTGPLAMVQNVQYSNVLPHLNPRKHTEKDILFAATLSKSKQWIYEKEWRLVLPNHRDTELPFPASDLVAVIIGCRMGSTAKRELFSILAERKTPITLFESRMDRYRYGITIEGLARITD